MNKEIIFVDDERPILRAIRRLFMGEPYTCKFFDNGADALLYMEEHGAPNLVITDMRMPEMTGLELLKEVKYKYPATLRLVLSGYTDNKVIMTALEKNYSQFYLHKPFKNEALLDVINRLLGMQDIMMSEQFQLKVDEIGSLPTLPSLYQTITDMIRDDVTVEAIVKKISEDFVMTGNILHIANSAYYGSKVSTVKQAIMMLGLNNVQQIIVATDVFKENSGQLEDLGLWEHAFLTNQITTYLYEKKFASKIPVNASSAGMMHSIGIILMLTKFEARYDAVLELKEKKSDKGLLDIEKTLLGINHMELGGFLMNWWEMSLPMIESALYYRNPNNDLCLNTDIIKVVHIAAHVAWHILDKDLFNYPLNSEIALEFGLDEEGLVGLIEKFKNC